MPDSGRAERQLAPPRRVRRGELVCAGGALGLLIIMFAFAWFGVDGIPGRSEIATAENAWHGLTLLRWLMLLTIFVAIGSLFLHASQRTHGAETDTSLAITVLGTLTAVALAYRVLIDLPSSPSVVDQKLGAYLGLLCAIAIAIGGYDALLAARRAEQAREGVQAGAAGDAPAEDPVESPNVGAVPTEPGQPSATAVPTERGQPSATPVPGATSRAGR
jgi:hypothetical protein